MDSDRILHFGKELVDVFEEQVASCRGEYQDLLERGARKLYSYSLPKNATEVNALLSLVDHGLKICLDNADESSDYAEKLYRFKDRLKKFREFTSRLSDEEVVDFAHTVYLVKEKLAKVVDMTWVEEQDLTGFKSNGERKGIRKKKR